MIIRIFEDWIKVARAGVTESTTKVMRRIELF